MSDSQPRLKVSAISFLNTAPLMWNFAHGRSASALAGNFDVEYTLPSICAEKLQAATADIGIIPVAAYTWIPGLRILPDVAIAAKGPVRSILLIAKKPLADCASIAADTTSRTSVALMQVLLAKHFPPCQGGERKIEAMPPHANSMLAAHDACLLIGDAALLARPEAERKGYRMYDLALEWQRMTGLPFVFAFWAVREAALFAAASHGLRPEYVVSAFKNSRDEGKKHLGAIVAEWSSRIALPPDEIFTYLSVSIDYSLDQANLAGLQLFYRYAQATGALPRAPELRFL